jgi:hypothetical protein
LLFFFDIVVGIFPEGPSQPLTDQMAIELFTSLA